MRADDRYNTVYTVARVTGAPVVRHGKNGKDYVTVPVEMVCGQRQSAFCLTDPPMMGSTVVIRVAARERGLTYTVLSVLPPTKQFLIELVSCLVHDNPETLSET